MIEYLRGKIAELEPACVVLDVLGVGYSINISLNSYTALQGREEAKLYIYESIREDAWVLYGFATKEERALFVLLTSVSGVGGGTARMILSAMTPQELVTTIEADDERSLQTVKGIGMRTAQRIIVELRDKVGALHLTGSQKLRESRPDEEYLQKEEEAVGALTMLGFAPAPSRKIVDVLLHKDSTLSTEELIKHALKEM